MMKRFYSVEEINNAVRSDPMEYISLCSEEYEQKLDSVTENILKDNRVDIVLLAGPSSSGKTTTANKIAERIRQRGKNAYIISLDDFYFNRDDIPINSDGLPDYENITALDLPLIKECFNSLIVKRSAVLPTFNFFTGLRELASRPLELKENDVLIVEGIHALNGIITQGIDNHHIFRVYISVSSRITGVDGKILLTKRNIRFTRRMIRDYHFRSTQTERTFFLWSGVRKGEDRFIFPYKSNASEFINSFHPFELCLFRDEAVKRLSSIGEDSEYFDEAQRLKESLELFEPIDLTKIGEDSLLHEFIG